MITDGILRVQTVLYETDQNALKTSYMALAHAARRIVKDFNFVSRVVIAYGDCSPRPCLSPTIVESWQTEFVADETVEFEYHFFNNNLGSARGHNTLMDRATGALTKGGEGGYVAIMNPDVKVTGNTLVEMLKTLDQSNVGIVEARQLPIEHPKVYSEKSGATSWVSTALALTTSQLFWEIDGFDADSFFLYGDDVDFSWRLRSLGVLAVFQPSAIVFHDKRLSTDGKWQSSDPEKFYSAQASLMITHKWSRPDLTEKYLSYFRICGDEVYARVAEDFKKRLEDNELPQPLDEDHKIGQFEGLEYSKNRF